MKKLTTIISIALLSLSASAENYYYYDGGKVKLTEDSTKVAIISKKEVSPTILSNCGMKPFRNFSDDLSKIMVLEKIENVNPLNVRRLLLPQSERMNILPCYKDVSGRDLTPSGYIYVALKSQSDYSKLQNIAAKYNCLIVNQDEYMPLWYTLHLSEESGLNPVDVANAIYETGEFASASPSFFSGSLLISYDSDIKEQWGLYNSENPDIDISAASAWNYSTGRGIKVAVIDVGICLTTPDLKKNIYSKSYDASKGKSPSGIYYEKGKLMSDNHGTHCAGIIGAVRNNKIGIAGVAPDAKLMSISIDFDNATEDHYVRAINWASNNGADVISCSWNCSPNDYIKSALINALTNGRNKKGCVIVCAAGNIEKPNDPEYVLFPANCDERIISVGNLCRDGKISSDSCHGDNLFVCAPGTKIYTTDNIGTFSSPSGTSMACPHVAGIAALILSRNSNLTSEQVRGIIATSTKKVGGEKLYNTTKKFGSWNERYGYGLVDAYKAMMKTQRDF